MSYRLEKDWMKEWLGEKKTQSYQTEMMLTGIKGINESFYV